MGSPSSDGTQAQQGITRPGRYQLPGMAPAEIVTGCPEGLRVSYVGLLCGFGFAAA